MSFFLKRTFEDGRVLHVDAKDSDMKVERKRAEKVAAQIAPTYTCSVMRDKYEANNSHL